MNQASIAGLVERLRALLDSDHKRGCQGRTYSCSCGYDDAMNDALREAAAALESLSHPATEWVAVGERLPEMGQNVLLYFRGDMSTWIACRSYHSDASYPIAWKTQAGSVLVRGWKDDEEPSHWMPLPPPPAADK